MPFFATTCRGYTRQILLLHDSLCIRRKRKMLKKCLDIMLIRSPVASLLCQAKRLKSHLPGTIPSDVGTIPSVFWLGDFVSEVLSSLLMVIIVPLLLYAHVWKQHVVFNTSEFLFFSTLMILLSSATRSAFSNRWNTNQKWWAHSREFQDFRSQVVVTSSSWVHLCSG